MVLIFGVACAAAGGELFVHGAVGMAQAARVSGAIIGVTVAAFATSSPELAVAISSSLAQKPQIALGDALGSSIVNVALIMGLVLVISPIQSPRSSVSRDFPVALAVPVATAILCLNGTLSRIDGALLLCLFMIWLTAVLREARRQREAAEAAETVPGRRAAACAIGGLALLFLAGQLIVSGAQGIAASFGISEFVIGATIVAVGTSVPELATALIAKWRGHDEVGLGTILGSNIFNGLWIVPVAAMIHPIDIEWPEVAAALIIGVLATAIIFPPRDGLVGRGRGTLLVLLYGAYMAVIFMS
jgi:cation:H+ antiporter